MMQATPRMEDTTTPGGWREMWRLAWPLIVSNSFFTLQITIDRVMLGRLDAESVGAAMAAAVFFWTPMILGQATAGYAMTFVAQYFGAGRLHRIGPAVWQAFYFSFFAGLLFLLPVPFAADIISWAGHSDKMQALETPYIRCLCFSAMPTMLTAAASSFFTGRGDSRTVMWINGVGLVTNAFFNYVWIYGNLGFPAMGIEGAGWATVLGNWASAVTAFALMARRRYRAEFATLSGWRFEGLLFRRLLRFGLPSGLQWAFDCFAFALFLVVIGQMGDVELAATSITFSLNMLAFIPMLGIGQAVTVLVGQRLGENDPDLAARSTRTGFQMAWLYMTAVSATYLFCPGLYLLIFQTEANTANWASLEVLIPVLLRFVAVYSLFDSMNLIYSFALKGAGDTRFVTLVALTLSWPIMVLPTFAARAYGWGLEAAWCFASAYIILQAFLFFWRFKGGKWRSMRVIEPVVVETTAAEEPAPMPAAATAD
ncbi:MAG: MATE family efflux transporter [Gemmataceae bacterium]|nr:MATE family efflux transporter [Gemmataceae bacterium]MCI0738316.1 MATE family efflux transporter [Gemmataceae bacterium]